MINASQPACTKFSSGQVRKNINILQMAMNSNYSRSKTLILRTHHLIEQLTFFEYSIAKILSKHHRKIRKVKKYSAKSRSGIIYYL